VQSLISFLKASESHSIAFTIPFYSLRFKITLIVDFWSQYLTIYFIQRISANMQNAKLHVKYLSNSQTKQMVYIHNFLIYKMNGQMLLPKVNNDK
jgi:hypothetical protein